MVFQKSRHPFVCLQGKSFSIVGCLYAIFWLRMYQVGDGCASAASRHALYDPNKKQNIWEKSHILFLYEIIYVLVTWLIFFIFKQTYFLSIFLYSLSFKSNTCRRFRCFWILAFHLSSYQGYYYLLVLSSFWALVAEAPEWRTRKWRLA